MVPSTLAQISLWAERADGTSVCGESAITSGRGPAVASGSSRSRSPTRPALDAIAGADLVLLGPGSLFTSVLPHLAVPELVDAIGAASGVRAYVCNVMTQPGETDGFDAVAHLERVMEAARGAVDVIVVHEGPLDPVAAAAYAAQGQEPSWPTPPACGPSG